jgi:site-specific recombinase XerD
MPARPLQKSEVMALYAATRNDRERALVVLLWRSGLRVAEACALEIQDLEPLETGARLHIRCGKGGKARYVGLDAAGWAVVADQVNGRPSGPVLATRSHTPLQTHQARRTIRMLAARAGLRARIHPHALRHTFARESHDEGWSVREIQMALGHASLGTTAIYLASIGCNEAVEKAAERSW